MRWSNMDAARSGPRRDYVRMRWLMLQQKAAARTLSSPLGCSAAMRDFIARAALQLGVTLEFEGQGVDEELYVARCHGRDNWHWCLGKSFCAWTRAAQPTEVRRSWATLPAPVNNWAGVPGSRSTRD